MKNLKVSDIVDRFATYSFTYPASALRLWDRGYYDEDGDLWISDTSDTESVAQLYFRVQVLDAAKKVVSDTYINPYIAYENSVREYNAKTKTYTFKRTTERSEPQIKLYNVCNSGISWSNAGSDI